MAVLGPEALGFTERKASLDEALRGIPGLTVQNRRDYGLTGGTALSIRAPPSEPMLGIRGLAVIQDRMPLTTTEPGNVDLGAAEQASKRMMRKPTASGGRGVTSPRVYRVDRGVPNGADIFLGVPDRTDGHRVLGGVCG